jgi:hypothetical protein
MNAFARQMFRVGSQCKLLVSNYQLWEMTGGPLIVGCTYRSQDESKLGFRGRGTPAVSPTISVPVTFVDSGIIPECSLERPSETNSVFLVS